MLSNQVHSAVAEQDEESIIMMHGSPEPTEVDRADGTLATGVCPTAAAASARAEVGMAGISIFNLLLLPAAVAGVSIGAAGVHLQNPAGLTGTTG